MTAIALPRPRKKQSKPAQVAKTAAKVWTSMKIGSAAAKTAKKGAKAAGEYKAVKFVSKKGGKVLLVPLAVGGGLVAWKKVRSSSSDEGPATPYGSGVGPAATPQTVTPPKTAPGTHNGEGSLGDPPADSSNPPAGPAPGTTS